MGKGKRNSQERREKQAALHEEQLAKKKTQAKKKGFDRAVAAVCIVIAALVVAILVIGALGEAGVFLRSQLAMGREDVKVNSAMMTYWVNEYITNWYSQNYVYVAYGLCKLDLSSDFSTQYITATDLSYGYLGESAVAGMSWYDYFVGETAENVKMYLTYVANAQKAGMAELSDEDKTEIDNTIKSIKSSLKSAGMSFSDQYGKGVKETDVRACYELVYIASNYSEYIQDTFKSELENETADKDDALITFINENKKDFYSADILSYSFDINSKNFDSDLEYDAMVELVKTEFAKIEAAKTPAEFLELVEVFKGEYDKGDKSDKTESETGTEAETETEASLDDYRETVKYETDDELGKWLFEEGADVNDVKVVEETGTETEKADSSEKTEAETGSEATDDKKVYNTFKISVYMVEKKSDLNRTFTHNMGYMISDSKELAQAFLDAFKAESSKSLESFEKLAEKHYNDIHKIDEDGNHNHEEGESEPTFNYEKVEKLAEKAFATNMGSAYAPIDEWIDSEERKAGDLTAELITFKSGETEYYAAVYLDSHDEEVWRVNSFNGVLSDRIETWYDAEIAKDLITDNMAWIDIQTIHFSATDTH